MDIKKEKRIVGAVSRYLARAAKALVVSEPIAISMPGIENPDWLV